MSPVTRQVSSVTCQVSGVIFFFFLTNWGSLSVKGLLSMGPTPSSYWKRMENLSQKGSPASIYLEQPILLLILTLLQSYFECVYVFVPLV